MDHMPALPTIVFTQEFKTARAALLEEENALAHAQDALAARRRRMPMTPAEKTFMFAPGEQAAR
jgi:predicted dithiol-disulfide oxidoreductase (DUF899 family)